MTNSAKKIRKRSSGRKQNKNTVYGRRHNDKGRKSSRPRQRIARKLIKWKP